MDMLCVFRCRLSIHVSRDGRQSDRRVWHGNENVTAEQAGLARHRLPGRRNVRVPSRRRVHQRQGDTRQHRYHRQGHSQGRFPALRSWYETLSSLF